MFRGRVRFFGTSLLMAALLIVTSTSTFAESVSTANIASDSISASDAVVLSVKVGSNTGELGYLKEEGGGEGPEAFTVNQDNSIFIVDNVNKRVNIYKDGLFSYQFDIKNSHYIRSIVTTPDKVYLLDYDKGSVYITSLQGQLLQEVQLPEGVDRFSVEKLYKDQNDKVWLYANNNSYPVSDTQISVQSKVAGFSEVNGLPLTINKSEKTATILQNSNKVEISTNELLGSANVLNIDQSKNLYIDVFEQIDTPKVTGEYTVRKYNGNRLVSVAPIDLNNYYFTPNNMIEITSGGDLYQIICLQDTVQIVKKAFVPSASYKSKIPQIKQAALKELAAENSITGVVGIAAVAPNSRTTTQSNANAMSALTWTYNAANKSNPNPSYITTPDYLVGVSTPSSQTGIPYAWGGFDGLTTHSSSSWTNFSNAMSLGKFAGNVNTNTSGYQSGTAGLDCSGFVGAAAGFTSKLSTTNLASTTYTYAITASSRQIYDIYVKSGSHVLFYTGTNGTGINTREATTSGDDKTKAYARTQAYLDSEGYVLRRFNGW